MSKPQSRMISRVRAAQLAPVDQPSRWRRGRRSRRPTGRARSSSAGRRSRSTRASGLTSPTRGAGLAARTAPCPRRARPGRTGSRRGSTCPRRCGRPGPGTARRSMRQVNAAQRAGGAEPLLDAGHLRRAPGRCERHGVIRSFAAAAADAPGASAAGVARAARTRRRRRRGRCRTRCPTGSESETGVVVTVPGRPSTGVATVSVDRGLGHERRHDRVGQVGVPW